MEGGKFYSNLANYQAAVYHMKSLSNLAKFEGCCLSHEIPHQQYVMEEHERVFYTSQTIVASA